MKLRRAILAAVTATAVVAPLVAQADDWSDSDYLAYDADNMARTLERQGYHATTPDYLIASGDTFSETWLAGQQRQLRDLADGRIYASVGQAAPGGNVGDPEAHRDGVRVEVELLNREGTRLVGNVWPCERWLDGGAACPGVVVTTGSIQVTQHMYGWLARHLTANGYTVFTYDVRGQGESETTTHPEGNPFPNPANPQDGANFVNGTVDALRYFLSDAADPYVPVGWSSARRAAADDGAAAGSLSWSNPLRDSVDGDRLGLVGHSLGAGAVATVQQCTSTPAGAPVADADLPAGCAGERWPIRAIVAYDSLSSGVTPVVPAFDHQSDGYFVNAVPTPRAPDPDVRTGAGSAYAAWRSAGLDTCQITGRGFTHAEWTQIPFIVSATRYGVPQAQHYTLGWLDRYVGDGTASTGFAALADGPIPAEAAGEHLDHRASLFSGKHRSACHVTDPDGGSSFSSPDLRAYAGVAAVGDWAALNAEDEHGTPDQGAAHL